MSPIRRALLIASGALWMTVASPAVMQPADALGGHAQQLFRDANQYWSQRFAALGGHYLPAMLTLFNGTLSGACNATQSLTGSFYCPANQQVYIDTGFQRRLLERTANADDAALAYVMGHEVAHHVQNLLGTTALVEQARSRSTAAVSTLTWTSAELQADCYAGLWLRTAIEHGTVKLGANSGALLDAIAAVTHEQQTHLEAGVMMVDPLLNYGTAAQRLKWFQNGLRGTGLADCDTFSAEAAGKL